ncbi:xanthine dehydrogenase accessory factor [Inquilinus ginsengisoli]|uniref:Xanthine dehydrogenase accessory factor n=1 Tax=Inquilinus ginsengisoli TaxID=363840 RepID=A0ABU1JWS0_9PROT|nr:XdhC family protein [Inquilinus ginsengisoli]MDR6293072.1 xanthine dehydrogenase accessory factor [Inquilinus ginsengisoli]
MKREILDALQAARAEHRAAALVTDLAGGAQALVIGDAVTGDLAVDDAVRAAVREAIRHNRSRATPDGRLFVQAFVPPLRLAIVGAVHIAQSLAPIAALAGYDVTVIDPRRAFASDERFPGVAVSTEWPDDGLAALKPDARTAVVTLTHDPKLDDPALDLALRSQAFYIAALGSRKTHAGRLERLTARGHGPETLARIHGPAGLALGAVSPAEIAISVMAQMTAVLHGAEPLGPQLHGQEPHGKRPA